MHVFLSGLTGRRNSKPSCCGDHVRPGRTRRSGLVSAASVSVPSPTRRGHRPTGRHCAQTPRRSAGGTTHLPQLPRALGARRRVISWPRWGNIQRADHHLPVRFGRPGMGLRAGRFSSAGKPWLAAVSASGPMSAIPVWLHGEGVLITAARTAGRSPHLPARIHLEEGHPVEADPHLQAPHAPGRLAASAAAARLRDPDFVHAHQLADRNGSPQARPLHNQPGRHPARRALTVASRTEPRGDLDDS